MQIKFKILFFILIAGLVILSLYLIDRFYSKDDPLFFFYSSLFKLTGVVFIACLVLLITKLIGKFSINGGVIIFSFSLVNAIVLVSVLSNGMSRLYYICLFLNIIISIIFGINNLFITKSK